jgi:hypothetical protein
VHSASGTFQVCAAAVIVPVAGRGGAAARDLTRVLRRVVRRLFNLDLLPIDLQFLRDQHRQARLDALSDLGVLGDDRDDAVGANLDEVAGQNCRPWRRTRGLEHAHGFERLEIGGEHHASAGEGGDAQEGTAIDG